MKRSILFSVSGLILLIVCALSFTACKEPGGGGSTKVTYYNITIDPTITGGVVSKNPLKAASGKTVVLTIEPRDSNTVKEDYPYVETDEFDPVFVTRVLKDHKYTFTMPASDVFVRVVFEAPGGGAIPTSYAVTADTGVNGGVLTITSALTGGKAKVGDTVSFTAIPEGNNKLSDGYPKVERVSGGDVEVTPGTAGSYSFKMVDGDVIIKAVFVGSGGEVIDYYSITIIPPAGGTLGANPSTHLYAGDNVTLTAAPANAAVQDVIYIRVIGNKTGKQVRVFDLNRFTMPDESVTISVMFGPKQAMPILIDGAPLTGVQIWNEAHHLEGYYTYETISEIEMGGGLNGNPTLVITLDDQWSNLVFINADDGGNTWPYTIDNFGALSLWTRCDEGGAVIGALSFGNDDYAVTYKGENNSGIVVGTEWQRVLIPVPNPSKIVGGQLLALNFGAGDLFAKTLYVDRVEFVYCTTTVEEIKISPLNDIAKFPGETDVASLLYDKMAVKYMVDGTPVTLIHGSAEFQNWFDITYTIAGDVTFSNGIIKSVDPAAFTNNGNYTLSASFGGKTSNTINAKVSRLQFTILDNFATGSASAPGLPGSGFENSEAPDGHTFKDPFWEAVYWAGRSSEYGNSFALMAGGVNGGAAGKINIGPWDMTIYDAFAFDYLIKDGTKAGAIPNNYHQVRFDVQIGGVWYNGPVIQNTLYLEWTSKTILKSQFTGVTDWSNVTGWRLYVVNRGTTQSVFFIADLKATTVD